jgi:hypothetical protein
MAQVVRVPRLADFVKNDLRNLLGFWRGVPELAEEWPEWDENSRLDVIHQWPIEREALQRVMDASAAGILNEQQQRDWLELSGLIEIHRDTVERMLGEPV